ncbi:MAG TPA: hypothetical protein VMC84_12260 [Methanocella sp.]|uniref:hypothetical protein n=1 Tax=Methanocella sp. TaxID=2052833 RepID=UPI002C755946|nr:hypothetical protein [Methanocella sp.]HTY91940.1 hypothetical protein [Methanocella sp.]
MKCNTHPDVDAVGTCTSCGKAVCADCAAEKDGKVFCKTCVEKMAIQPPAQAAAQPVSPAVPVAEIKKEPFFSLVLSFLGMFVMGFIGLGQIYNGQFKKGIILTVGNWVLGCGVGIIYLLGVITIIGAVCCLPVLLIPLVLWIYAMYDAYVTADQINKGEPVKDWLD